MGILGRVSVPRFVGRGANDAKAADAEDKASGAVMEDRRRHKRTAAEEEAVLEFRRLLAEMLGESPPDEAAELDPEPVTEATRDQGFSEPAAITFAVDHSGLAEVTDTATSAPQDEEGSLDLSPATPLQEDTTDAAEEDQINPPSVIEPDPIIQEDLDIEDEQQITPVSADRERVRIELKDGRRLEAWRRSSPSTDVRLLILDVITAFDSQAKEIPSTPADSFIFRSEVFAINGAPIHQEQQSNASALVNPSPHDQTPEEKERF
ncbi:MAG: hypothetical protein QOH48_877 [Actinomycetota bacterium]|nr:hypothetical protein [Actinomycetota bacterium]